MLVTHPTRPTPFFSPAILGYTTLRLAIGMSMLIHGVARIPKYSAFVQATTAQFVHSPLPQLSVAAFARITPPVELLIGLLVFFGFQTPLGLTAGGLWMVLLIFGSTLIENFNIVAIQLLYALIFCYLLQHTDQNRLSLDGLIQIKRQPTRT